jgi:HEAT repeat protein
VSAVFHAYTTARSWSRHGFDESLRRLPIDVPAYDAALKTLVKRGEIADAVSLIAQFGVRNLNSVQVLTNAICSTNVLPTEAAFGQLRYCRRYKSFVLPALKHALKNGNQASRLNAVSTLECYEADAVEAIPELVAALKSEDGELRYRAARALESMGPTALPAVQALTSATNDSSVMVQRVATRVLNNLKKDTDQ